MSVFTKFGSMFTEHETLLNMELFRDYKCVVTEKIHGSNFSVYFFPRAHIFGYASRSQMLQHNGKFMNFTSFFTAAFETTFAENIKNNPFFSSMYENLSYIRFIGELFPTQTSYAINYGSNTQWRCFHIEYCCNGTTHHCTWPDIVSLCAQMKVPLVSEIIELNNKSISEIWYTFEHAFNSKLLPIDNDTCEGIVIRIDHEQFKGCDVATFKSTFVSAIMNEAMTTKSPIFFKKRNVHFLENKPRTYCSDSVIGALKCYVTRQRISNVHSQRNFKRTEIQEFADAVLKDVHDEYARSEGYAAIPDDLATKYNKILSKYIISSILKYIYVQNENE